MSRAEKLELMHLLWDHLVRDAENIESPEWHGEVLEDRLEKVKQGNGGFLSLDEVRKRLS